MRNAQRIGPALGGHLRQIGLRLGEPKAYFTELGDKYVRVDREVEMGDKTLTYTKRYIGPFSGAFGLPILDDQNKLNKGIVPDRAHLDQETLEISDEVGKTIFQYMTDGHGDKFSSIEGKIYALEKGNNLREEKARPKEAVREAMKILIS